MSRKGTQKIKTKKMKYENFKSWIEKYHIFIFVKFNHCIYCNTNMDE
jgi:hypothetical protein